MKYNDLYPQPAFDISNANAIIAKKFPFKCVYCGNFFMVERKKVNYWLTSKLEVAKKYHKYCARACSNLAQNQKVIIICARQECNLSKEIYVKDVSESGRNFCSQSCAANYNNNHKEKGIRRSKFEQWVEEKLTQDFPLLKIDFNKKSVIESELDIFIPSLHLGFEINGIHHYKPIYGEKKFLQIQSNDAKKITACHEQNINLIVIDISSIVVFSIKKASPFYQDIKNKIEMVHRDRIELSPKLYKNSERDQR